MLCNKHRINDVVRLTGISRNTLYRYMRNGTLDYIEIEGIRYVEQYSIDDLIAEKSFSSNDSVYPNGESEVCKELRIIANELAQIRILLQGNNVTNSRNGDSIVVRKSKTPVVQQRNSGVSRNVTTANSLREMEAYNRVVEVLERHYSKGGEMPLQKDMAIEADVSTSTFRKHQRVWQSKTS